MDTGTPTTTKSSGPSNTFFHHLGLVEIVGWIGIDHRHDVVLGEVESHQWQNGRRSFKLRRVDLKRVRVRFCLESL